MSLEVHELCPITDLFHDNSTFVQTVNLVDTGNTSSPFSDCKVKIQVELTIDDKIAYSNLDESNLENGLSYDLEEYQLPPLLRRVLKQMKILETVKITSSNKSKLDFFLPDKNEVFVHQHLRDFKQGVEIKVKLLEIEQKLHLFKIPITEKVDRLMFWTRVAGELTASGLQDKALKVYKKINRYYRNKDTKKNFLEEDEDTLEYRNCIDEIDGIHMDNFCGFSKNLLNQN